MIPAGIKILSLFIVFIGILWGVKFFAPKSSLPQVIVNGQTIFVEIADTPTKIVQGLSGREKLAANQGMLFVFEQPGRPVFWMKEMHFALDFLFIRSDTIVDTVENVPFPKPGQEPQTVNAGQIKKLGLKIGDKVK